MHDLNDALDELRGVIPYAHSPSVRKLSKIATLLLAKNYILMQANALDELRRLIAVMNSSGVTLPPGVASACAAATAIPNLSGIGNMGGISGMTNITNINGINNMTTLPAMSPSTSSEKTRDAEDHDDHQDCKVNSTRSSPDIDPVSQDVVEVEDSFSPSREGSPRRMMDSRFFTPCPSQMSFDHKPVLPSFYH
jgi:hypothetical protein